jgi:hypothetical protein
LEDAYHILIVEGVYYILEGKGNYTYTVLNIRIMPYCETNSETNLILLSILGEDALDNLYLLDSYGIYGDDRGYVIKYYIYIWLLVSVLGQAIKVGDKKVI